MNSTTECDNQITNEIKIDVKKKEVSSSKKSLKISHRKRNFRYKPY
jgi:hypothetical protein